ncbi:SPOR domain-containing protein [Dongia mobilis]|jgi:cell division septation protein DedD|uniref:SPOR domain-containing protein n=1 Tax=Dongia sp. TaxID=1977262 RepID=UPI0026F2A1D7
MVASALSLPAGSIRRQFKLATMALACLPFLLIQAIPAQADLAAAEAAIAAKDYDAAVSALQPLVEAGDGFATWKLASLYLGGHAGSMEEGITLLKKAAQAGEPDAQARLGVMYAKGEGVEQSDTEAYKWLSLAARGASPGVSRVVAETNQVVVGQRLSAAQRNEAKTESEAAATEYQAAPVVEAAPAPAAVETEIASLPDPAAAPAIDGGYRLQLASVPNEGDVEGEWKRLKRRIGAPLDNLDLHVERADLGTKGIFYRLQAGPFADRSAAAATCEDIKAAGGDCLIVGP